MSRSLRTLNVHVLNPAHSHGVLMAGLVRIPCLVGRTGLTSHKREGDGATPRGMHPLIAWRYRPDRMPRPALALAPAPLARDEGWCDEASHASYNRPVQLPFVASHEDLWRKDTAYDVVGVLDWNFTRRVRGHGSAIFFHIAVPGATGTAGCIAIAARDMRKLLPRLSRAVHIRIV